MWKKRLLILTLVATCSSYPKGVDELTIKHLVKSPMKLNVQPSNAIKIPEDDIAELCKHTYCTKVNSACVPFNSWRAISKVYQDASCSKIGVLVAKDSSFNGLLDYFFVQDEAPKESENKAAAPSFIGVIFKGRRLLVNRVYYKDIETGKCVELFINLNTSAVYEHELDQVIRTDKLKGC